MPCRPTCFYYHLSFEITFLFIVFALLSFKFTTAIFLRYLSKMSQQLTELTSNKMYEGVQKTFSHESKEVGCKMNFAVFLPEQAEHVKLPVLYWLSGLTCTERNFIEKAGAQKYAADEGVILVCPDTSPRGLNIPGDSDSWDFGVGAGFYVDATQEPWKKNYRLYSYVTKELMSIVNANFPNSERQSIFGHSMGGHGALICALKNPALFRSVSALAPICNPTKCPWGVKAFSGYLGPPEKGGWTAYDATELVDNYVGPNLHLFVDQGTEDPFYKNGQLLPENLVLKCNKNDIPLVMKMREGYDHSFYYISTFIQEHIQYHAKLLKQ